MSSPLDTEKQDSMATMEECKLIYTKGNTRVNLLYNINMYGSRDTTKVIHIKFLWSNTLVTTVYYFHLVKEYA
jgi:hypothetical protein